jgi:hypothetical protein
MATRRSERVSEEVKIDESSFDAINEQLARSRIIDAAYAHIREDLGANVAASDWSLDFGLHFGLVADVAREELAAAEIAARQIKS